MAFPCAVITFEIASTLCHRLPTNISSATASNYVIVQRPLSSSYFSSLPIFSRWLKTKRERERERETGRYKQTFLCDCSFPGNKHVPLRSNDYRDALCAEYRVELASAQSTMRVRCFNRTKELSLLINPINSNIFLFPPSPLFSLFAYSDSLVNNKSSPFSTRVRASGSDKPRKIPSPRFPFHFQFYWRAEKERREGR